MKVIRLSAFALAILIQACNNETNNTTENNDTGATGRPDSLSGNSTNAMPRSVPVDSVTAAFLMDAAEGGMMEVQHGQAAQEKAASQSVKDFGMMMVRDHTAANDKLKALAASRNVTLPATPGKEHQKMMDELNKKSGTAFDKAYMKAMVEDHQKDVKEFEKAESRVTDTEVKAFIANTLPTLRTHLDSAKAVHKRLK